MPTAGLSLHQRKYRQHIAHDASCLRICVNRGGLSCYTGDSIVTNTRTQKLGSLGGKGPQDLDAEEGQTSLGGLAYSFRTIWDDSERI